MQLLWALPSHLYLSSITFINLVLHIFQCVCAFVHGINMLHHARINYELRKCLLAFQALSLSVSFLYEEFGGNYF